MLRKLLNCYIFRYMSKYQINPQEQHNSLFHALADPTRREILKLLQKGDSTPGEIGEHFTITRPSLSHHLDILKRAHLVITERQGQRINYSLNVSVFEEVAALMMDLFNIGKSKGRDDGKK
jgi:ArsR family transcriptional regulator, arsenate/arsenite/antimonite-responsive transcriptional repressor